jgi:hypothetical protein
MPKFSRPFGHPLHRLCPLFLPCRHLRWQVPIEGRAAAWGFSMHMSCWWCGRHGRRGRKRRWRRVRKLSWLSFQGWRARRYWLKECGVSVVGLFTFCHRSEFEIIHGYRLEAIRYHGGLNKTRSCHQWLGKGRNQGLCIFSYIISC